jgi:hypothetical protein
MAETAETIIARYTEVRHRLRNLPPPPPESQRRLIRVRPQPHRPDYVPPAMRLPTVIITEETKQRVHDILVIAQENRSEPLDAGHWHDIVREVCVKHEITKSELMSVRRARNIVAARHEAMWRMSKETSMSLPAIGRRMGGKDHTTVLHGIRRHEAKVRGEVYVMPRYGKALEGAGL